MFRDSLSLPRRDFLAASAGLASGSMAGLASAQSPQAAPQAGRQRAGGKRRVRAISSANGQQATRIAYDRMTAGEDTLKAVVAGVAVVEADPEDTSVGYGGLPNERGVVELDAAVMHGPSHRAGAVASLRNIRHPAQVALKVLYRTDHVLLVGSGALEFARAHGFRPENLLTDKARKIWLHWKENLSQEDDWLPPPDIDPNVAEFFGLGIERHGDRTVVVRRRPWVRPTGTIHCAGLNAKGELSCTTTTSGLAFKVPGRVGDSPIIGAGLYCDNEVGSCGSTGRGEANLQNQCSFAAVELMRQGLSPREAGLEVLRRVAKTTSEKQLLDEEGRPNFGLKFYVMNRDGEYAGVTMWGPSKFAVTDDQGTRLEDCAALYEKN